MTELFKILEKNPAVLLAVFSIIIFPLGMILLGWAAKALGIGNLVKVMNDHVAAEVKIEGRLAEIVNEIKSLISANWDNRRYYDEKFDHFDHRFQLLDGKIDSMIEMLPKRRGD
jgi:hypothetical protein